MKRSKTPTFLLELPLQVNPQQAKHLRAHCFSSSSKTASVLSLTGKIR
jgi:hypothetical protein